MLGHALSPLKSRNVRVRDANWYLTEADLKREQPFCVKHLALGEQVVATQTDHIVPLVQGGSNDRSNLQRLCTTCHEAKTATEQQQRHAY
jgi:5-methylcytosine-specific restriction protein A